MVVMALHYSNGVRFHARCIFRTYSIIYSNINLESPPGSPNKSEKGRIVISLPDC